MMVKILERMYGRLNTLVGYDSPEWTYAFPTPAVRRSTRMALRIDAAHLIDHAIATSNPDVIRIAAGCVASILRYDSQCDDDDHFDPYAVASRGWWREYRVVRMYLGLVREALRDSEAASD